MNYLSWYQNKKPVILFVAKFAIFMILFYGVLAIPFFDRLLYENLKVTAWLSQMILNLFGENTSLMATTIQSHNFSITVCRGCDAVEPAWMYCAAILSFKATTLQKILGILSGIVLFHLLNLLRIVSLFWIGVHLSSAFNSVHLEIWPVVFIVAELLFFILWIKISRRSLSRHA